MPQPSKVNWFQSVPFILMHVACLAVFWVGWSWTAVLVALVVYAGRVFGLTGFYHRYFSHRTFKTYRWVHFLGALLGNSAAQRGPLWWAAHHRNHHRNADTELDTHSPRLMGFWRSHTVWFLTYKNFATNQRAVPDLMKYPELRFVDRFDYLGPAILIAGLLGLGTVLDRYAPQLGTNAWQLLVWGFLISTVVLYHVTYSINSVAHRFGKRRYDTDDDSRNNVWLALFTFGEGWHNNHHFFQASARQGFYWWEIDVTYYLLVVMSWFGLVWDLKPVPERVLEQGRAAAPAKQSAPKPEDGWG